MFKPPFVLPPSARRLPRPRLVFHFPGWLAFPFGLEFGWGRRVWAQALFWLGLTIYSYDFWLAAIIGAGPLNWWWWPLFIPLIFYFGRPLAFILAGIMLYLWISGTLTFLFFGVPLAAWQLFVLVLWLLAFSGELEVIQKSDV
jgi:hypothetical protein